MQNYNLKIKSAQLNKDYLRIRTYKFSISVIRFVSKLPDDKIYRIIIDQLLRSATSIGANVIEAQAASSKKDFAKFFIIALKSANETKYWLEILRDITNNNLEAVEKLLSEATEIANMLGASVITLKKQKTL